MILIADSGSTKTTWMEVETGNKVVTEGLNPHFTSDEAFLAACSLIHQKLSILNSQFSVHFYGAGCGSAEQAKRVKRLLQRAFGTNNVAVETDMLGACRAACGNRAGLVGILGTGSNACYYDGLQITRQAVSTGYILGDHGSANHVGRQLLQDYLIGAMPTHLTAMFHDAYPQTKEEFLDAVYHQPHANRFLASLAKFALEHADEKYCSTLLEFSLIDWNNHQLESLWEQTLCRDLYLVGGFAARIKKSILNNFAQNFNLVIRSVVADPIDGLQKYHLNNN